MSEHKQHSGYVVLFGRPSTGKSSLVNRLVGSKIGIVSPKPQTTRQKILGVLTTPMGQVVFLDTPGYVPPKTKRLDEVVPFERKVREAATKTLDDADLVLLMFDASRGFGDEDQAVIDEAVKWLGRGGKHLHWILNKTDLVADSRVLEQREGELRKALLLALSDHAEALQCLKISALTGAGIEPLMDLVWANLPFGQPFYDAETLTDQTERQIAAEVVREKIFNLTSEEVPYGTLVQIQTFKDDGKTIRIQADIVVERDSLKGIIIGKRGQMIKEIGTQARLELNRFFDKKVHLELFVKVHPNWRKDEKALKEYGF